MREPTSPPPVASSTPLLEVDDVSVRFGAIQALDRVSLEIARGEIVAIIGPNGAGKTTLLNVISGFYHPTAGQLPSRGTTGRTCGPTTWPPSGSRARSRTWPCSRA